MNEEQKEKWYNSFTREQLIERCEYLQRSCERKENSIMELEMEKADLEKEIERLNSIIDKAIEYIRQLEFESEELYDISEFARLELLNILQGSDKE